MFSRLKIQTVCKGYHIGLDKQKNQRKIVNIFLPINFNICFGCSKEKNETVLLSTPQHMFWLRNKKIKFSLHTLI